MKDAMLKIPRLVIAAPASGSGKSTLAAGLMAAFSNGARVQGFKVGPDYIDPMYHTAACGRISRNLDTWMVSHEEVRRTFCAAASDADLAVIEGVMGLYDGYDAASESGSTAETAKLLSAPVILVLDVGKMARSAGALALGYRQFDPSLNIAGVVCNNVGSKRHASWVRQAVESVGLPVLGCLPKQKSLKIPERHLGLYTAVERQAQVQEFLSAAASLAAEHIDLDALQQIARQAAALPIPEPAALKSVVPRAGVRLAVARDEAFCFYYEDNLDYLRQSGAEIVFFSPLTDEQLPPHTAGVYLGGGYPELYAARCAANTTMKESIRAAHAAGLPIYAECGGLIYLTQQLSDLNGETHEMVGLIPGRACMQDKLTMGYRTLTARQQSLLMQPGEQARGHEFHYSDWLDRPAHYTPAYTILPRRTETEQPEGYLDGNLLASYVHLHFGSNPVLAANFVGACLRWQSSQSGGFLR